MSLVFLCRIAVLPRRLQSAADLHRPVLLCVLELSLCRRQDRCHRLLVPLILLTARFSLAGILIFGNDGAARRRLVAVRGA